MRVLVVGHRQIDAGKTTFSIGLTHTIDGVAVKPRAANDFWYDFDDVRRATSSGTLYGSDAARLAAINDEPWDDPTKVNPLHRLWTSDVIRTPSEGILGLTDRTFLLDRIGDEFVVNSTIELPQSLHDSLPLSGTTTVESIDELNAVTKHTYLSHLKSFIDELATIEPLVIESYGDIALPVTAITVDVVVGVQPGEVSIFDGERFIDACSVGSRSPREGTMEPVVPEVTSMIDPLSTVPIPPLTRDDQHAPTRVADAYDSAYRAVFEAVDSR